MTTKTFAIVAVGLVSALGLAVSAQQKPVSSRTHITVYKTPT